MAEPSGQFQKTGAARRERRLRSMLRHEQQTVRIALAAATHQNAQSRAEEEMVHEKHDGLRAQKRPSLGERPAPLLEVRPQGKLQRHAGIGYEIVQNLDVHAPQMVDQLPEILLFFFALSPVPEQVIEVPKILPDDVPMRTTVRDTQLGSTDDHILFLVAADSGAERRHSSSSSCWANRWVFKVFPPNRVQQRRSFPRNAFLSGLWSSSVTPPVFRGGPQGFRPGQTSSSSSHRPAGISEDTDEPGEGGFFALFPRAVCGAAPGGQLMDSGSLFGDHRF